jgi:Xaa-Pro aminopeptidase
MSDISERLASLRARMVDAGIDAFLVPRCDEHQSEYVAARDERVKYISGFTGSAGTVVVAADTAALFTDGRYTIQATRQLDPELFELRHSHTDDIVDWLVSKLGENATIGFDPAIHTAAATELATAKYTAKGLTLQAMSENPIDAIWRDQPSPPCGAVEVHDLVFAGESATSKRDRLAEKLRELGVDAQVITAPECLSWLFNIRGQDVPMTPVVFGYAIVNNDGASQLFVNPDKLNGEVLKVFAEDDGITLLSPEVLFDHISGLKGQTVLFDRATASVRFVDQARVCDVTPVILDDPIMLMKAAKSPHEIDGIRQAHLRDGKAMLRFLWWFKDTAPGNETEWTAAQQLHSERQKINHFKGPSFATISACGGNGAEAHYQLTEKTAAPIVDGSLYLVDSGGQYLDGTTDITRVMAVGQPTDTMRYHYTLVLKGHIALSRARFPKGTTGTQLDTLARQFLWEAGLDFDHGTGHGVGHFLSVHEGPQRISKAPSVALKLGMILSNEPGYYKQDAYGIRIENLVVVVKCDPQPLGADHDTYGFETLSFTPYERELIDTRILTQTELAWVDTYHSQVFDRMSDGLNVEELAFLTERTSPL